MKIRSVVAMCATVVALSVSTPVFAAAQTHVAVPVHTLYGKTKIIHLSVRNDTGAPLELKVGEDVMTLSTGKIIALKLPTGTRIVANTATAKFQAGTLLAEVSNAHSDATIGIR